MSHAFVYLSIVQCTRHLTEHPLRHLEAPGRGTQPQAWLPWAGEGKREGGQCGRLIMVPELQRTCDCYRACQKDLADGTELRISRWGDDAALSRWALSVIKSVLIKGRQESQRRRSSPWGVLSLGKGLLLSVTGWEQPTGAWSPRECCVSFRTGS